MPKLPKCDCLNFCGDDPDLVKKKAEPCDAMKRAVVDRAKVNAVRAKFQEALQCAKRDGQVTISADLMVEFDLYIIN